MAFRDLDRRHRDTRYGLVPQFEAYDGNEPVLAPYLTFRSRPDRDGPVFRTDGLGFRVSDSPHGPVDTASWPASGGGIVLGGSFVFGVGAGSDAATLPSVLAHRTGRAQLNLGIHAGNSLQELVAAVPFLAAAETVVVCSGINNVFAALQSLGHNEVYGPLFGEGALAALRDVPLADLPTGAPTGAVADSILPQAETGAELAARMAAALHRQLRDLAVLAAAAPGRVRFVLQPFADPTLRPPTPEEQRLHALSRERQGAWLTARDFVAAHWAEHAGRVAAGCARLGVPFLDLAARDFAGWSFYDRVHMTDHGYRQAAEKIAEVL